MFTSKVLLNDEFLTTFYPFYYLNSIVFVRKYNINDNYVEVITRKNIICAIFINFLIFCFYCFFIKVTNFGLTFKVSYCFIYFQYAFNFSAVCVSNLYFSSKSVRLTSILYEINKCLYSRKDLKNLKILVWVSIVLLITDGLVLLFFKLAYDSHWSLLRGIFILLSSLFDIELVQIMITVIMLSHQTRMWNSVIENTNFGKIGDEEITMDNEMALEDMNNALKSVNEAWDLIRSSSGCLILFHYITTFIQTMFYAEVLIVWSLTHVGEDNLVLSHAVGLVMLLSKAFFVEIGLCVACEEFYREITRAHTNIIVKLQVSQDLPSKRTWKNMFRIIQEDFEKLSACGIFVVDAATLLHFCDLVTTYIIVLLQFAFL